MDGVLDGGRRTENSGRESRWRDPVTPPVLSQENGQCRESKHREEAKIVRSMRSSSDMWRQGLPARRPFGCLPRNARRRRGVFKTNCPLEAIREPRCFVFRRGSRWGTVSRACTVVLPFRSSQTRTAGTSAEIWKKGIWNTTENQILSVPKLRLNRHLVIYAAISSPSSWEIPRRVEVHPGTSTNICCSPRLGVGVGGSLAGFQEGLRNCGDGKKPVP